MRAWFLVVFLLGCQREVDQAKPDPTKKLHRSGPSPTSGPAPAKTGAAKCVEGEAEAVTVEASATEAVESVTRAEIDDALCPRLPGIRRCIDTLCKGEQDFEATLEAKLLVGPGGELKVILDAGTLKDEAMRGCVRDGLLAASLPQGPGEGRYALRIRARRAGK